MKLNREEVLHIARLARVDLTEAEIDRLRSNFQPSWRTLRSAEGGYHRCPSTAQSIDLQSVMRDDEVAPAMPLEDVLANAPRREGDSFRVRAVLE